MERSIKKEPTLARKPAQVPKDNDRITHKESFVKDRVVELEKLTVEKYAMLAGISDRQVRRMISSGKIKAEEVPVQMGAYSKVYLIPLTELTLQQRKKYERLQRQAEPEQPVRKISLEELTGEEREEAAAWMRVLEEWEQFRNGYAGPKAEADLKYEAILRERYPELAADRQKLYRKKRLFEAKGAGGLIDGRGKHGSHKKAIPDEVWNVFEYYYLDQSRKSVAECIRLTDIYFRKHEIPVAPFASSSTFARAVMDRIPAPVLKYEREGKKAYDDKCGMYISRYYEDLHSNDIWVCDNHTFDIFIDDGKKVKPSRVYLTGFLDVRSRKMVGWFVTITPCSQATLYALRRGIERYGIPKRILADNGREFLTHDIGGRGHRKSADWGHEAPTILQNLQIEFRTAQVRNAKAKIIERAFRDVKDCFSKLFEGYTGGTTAERPERLKKTGKYAENFTPIEDFVRYVDKYIEGIFNYAKSDGIGMNGRTRNEVYEACLIEKRVASRTDLNLMMLRNSKPVTVRREGVPLPMYDGTIYFNSAELLYNHIGEKVYFRYDPDDLKEVRVYSEQDRFLCTASQQGRLSYYADKEEVKEKMKEIRELDRMVRSYKKNKQVKADNALELIMWQAEQNLAAGEELHPAVITPIRFAEKTQELPAAVGGGDMVDYSRMLEKYAKKGE